MKANIDIFAQRCRLIGISDKSVCDRSERAVTQRSVDCPASLQPLAFAPFRNVVDFVKER
jgi:hypothetical protein